MDTATVTAAPHDLDVKLTMTPEISRGLLVYEGSLEVAQAYEITSDADAIAVKQELDRTKDAIKKVEGWRKAFVEPANQIIATANAFFKGPAARLAAAETHLKGLLIDWTEKKQREAEEARRKAEAEERARRQEAERIAAAERARAEEKAREQERIAREAEEARAQAEREGNARAQAAAAAAAASARARADAEREKGEAKANETVLTAAAAAPTTVIPSAAPPAGFTVRDNWKAELAPNMEESRTVKAIALAIAAGREELTPMLKLDMSSADKLAKALKTAFNVPGLVAVNRPVAASRK